MYYESMKCVMKNVKLLKFELPIKEHTNRRIQQKRLIFMKHGMRTQHLDFVHDRDAS